MGYYQIIYFVLFYSQIYLKGARLDQRSKIFFHEFCIWFVEWYIEIKISRITNMPPHARWQSSLNGEKTVSSGWYFHTVKLNWKVRVINSYLRIWKRKFHIDISLYLKFHLSKLILNRFRPCNSNTYSIYSIEDFIMVTTFIL